MFNWFKKNKQIAKFLKKVVGLVNDDRKNESNNQLDEIKNNSPLPSIETYFIENDDKPLEVTIWYSKSFWTSKFGGYKC